MNLKNLAALMLGVAALLTAGVGLWTAVSGNRNNDLMLRSLFELSTTQTATIRERLAVVEATCERVPSSHPAVECRADDDCGQGRECRRGKCIDFVKATITHRAPLTYDNVQKFVHQKQAPLDMAAPDAPAAE